MMEIYNEAVYDLLGDNAKDSRQSPPGGSTRTSLDIRQNAAGGTSVPGLTEVKLWRIHRIRVYRQVALLSFSAAGR